MTKRNRVGVIAVCAGAVLFAAGILQGGYRDALNKAVHICMECIGIG